MWYRVNSLTNTIASDIKLLPATVRRAIKDLKKAGLVFSGMSPDGMLSEIVELPSLDWFVACQFHPEFKSRPERPHPLFKGLIDAVVKQKMER